MRGEAGANAGVLACLLALPFSFLVLGGLRMRDGGLARVNFPEEDVSEIGV